MIIICPLAVVAVPLVGWLTLKGRTYYQTPKTGTAIASGLAVVEFATDDDAHRVWVEVGTGVVWAD